jgi:hypothetical protein
LGVLRGIRAAGLPGRVVVAYDWRTGLCRAAMASQDAYTSERALVQDILACACPGDLFVMDRYYCTTPIIQALRARQACFVIRADERHLRCAGPARRRSLGRIDTGRVYEQSLVVEDTGTGERFSIRRLVLVLDQPTAEGEQEVRLLTNLPAAVAGLRIAELYRERWTLERHFDFLKNCLHGEIESLGKPAAALFMMLLALVASNALAVVRQAIRLTHGEEAWDKLSGFYLADELAKNYHAIDVLVAAGEWQCIQHRAPPKFLAWIKHVAEHIRPQAFTKHPRGPKQPRPRRASGKQRHHYSTHRLLHPD